MIDINRYHTNTTLQTKTLQTIYKNKQISRSQLMKILDLSLTSITKHVSGLMSDGIVVECGALESTGGRKSNLLRINPEYAYVLGIDIGGYAAKFGVIKMDGTILEDWFIQPLQSVFPAKTIDLAGLCDQISKVFSKYDPSRFLAICVGISGLVNHDEGSIIFCPNLDGWNNVRIADILSKSFNLPVFVDTSARCMALAEQQYGAGQGVSDQVFISLGNYDISSALIISSRLYRGSSGFTGEIGHVMSSGAGIRCSCGNYDCLELSATLIMITGRIYNEAKKVQTFSPLLQLLPADWTVGNLTPAIIQQAIQAGDKVCYEAVMTAGRHTGIALSNLMNVLNSGLVILGGSVIEFFPVMLETIRNTVRERTLVKIGQNLKILQAQKGWRGAVIGSAIMAHRKFFCID